MSTDWILYFGYGSLVNRSTRPPHEVAHSARLKGWQRVWDHRVIDPNRAKRCTSLNIEPLPDVAVEGVIVRLDLDQLPQLDAREAGYDRLVLPASDFDLPEELQEQMIREGIADTIVVYRSQVCNRGLADAEHPVLQSYIDCVMSGYLHRYGEEGVNAFVNSTRGWECPVFNDRAKPFYPRWVEVSSANQQYFDNCIDASLQQSGRWRQA